jgi:hypothetical protein
MVKIIIPITIIVIPIGRELVPEKRELKVIGIPKPTKISAMIPRTIATAIKEPPSEVFGTDPYDS